MPPSRSTEAIAVYTRLLEAWNRRDADAFAALFTPDGNHTVTAGRIAGRWRPIVDDLIGPGFAGVGRITFDGDRVRFLVVDESGVCSVSIRLAQ